MPGHAPDNAAPLEVPQPPDAPGPRRTPAGRLVKRMGLFLGGAALVAGLAVGGVWLYKRLNAAATGPLEESRALKLSRTDPVLHDPLGIDDQEGQALSRIFAKLRALEEGRAERVAILQLGASHTTGQYFADRVRERLQQRFGAAGRGFVAPGEPEGDRPHTGVVRKREGTWKVQGAIHQDFGQRWGLSGVRVEGQPGSSISFELCSDCPDAPIPSTMQVFTLHRPGDGKIEVLLDDRVVATLPRRVAKKEQLNVHTLNALGARQRLTLRAVGPGPSVVLGVSHELAKSGLVYDTAGLSGSTVWVPAGYEQPTFRKQLSARRPDLYILFWGTNEAVSSKLDVAAYSARYLDVLKTLRAAAPKADCLILGPTDRLVPRETNWLPAPSQEVVISALRKVARTGGCAFWSPRAAMGGDGSMRAWQQHQPSWALPDSTHLTREGYHALADLLVDDLIGNFAESRMISLRAASKDAAQPKR